MHLCFETEIVWRSCIVLVLVLVRNFTCTVRGGPRELCGEDHCVISVHVISSSAVYVCVYARLSLPNA